MIGAIFVFSLSAIVQAAGELDALFGNGGKRDAALQTDGKIVAAGTTGDSALTYSF